MLSEIFINWWAGVVLPIAVIAGLTWAGVHFYRRLRGGDRKHTS